MQEIMILDKFGKFEWLNFGILEGILSYLRGKMVRI
jgi:hypothetical protein